MTRYSEFKTEKGSCIRVSLALYEPEKGGGRAIFRCRRGVRERFERLRDDVEAALAALCRDYPEMQPVFKRWFLSDISNQAVQTACGGDVCAVSLTGQPPLGGGKLALWVYMREDVEVAAKGGGLYEVCDASGAREYWRAGIICPGERDSLKAGDAVLGNYIAALASEGLSLEADCHRTWFFVRDIDANYGGLVEARNMTFDREGLIDSTHYIASTGIGGGMERPDTVLSMDAYAAGGAVRPSVRYLYASGLMNRTSDYGVAFERGVALDFPGRSLVFVSGTASIDDKGRILAAGDIEGQAMRMIRNVDALLKEGGCSRGDVFHAIVYLRDTADADTVEDIICREFPGLPHVVVLAPVCRPGWLVEMECMAGR